MSEPARRRDDFDLQDLLELPHSHDEVEERCNYCGRDGADRDFDMVQEALRGRIRVLEAKVRDLEAMLRSGN
jgi:hypothetical protein